MNSCPAQLAHTYWREPLRAATRLRIVARLLARPLERLLTTASMLLMLRAGLLPMRVATVRLFTTSFVTLRVGIGAVRIGTMPA